MDGQLVTVLVNSADEAKTLSLEINGGYQAAQGHPTDETHKLEQVPTGDYVAGRQGQLPAKNGMNLVRDPALIDKK